MNLDADKLAKVCMMMTSAHDGEALAAARRASSMLKEAGLSWAQLIEKLDAPSGTYRGGPAPYSHQRPRPEPADSNQRSRWHDGINSMAVLAAVVRGIERFPLTDWEFSFIASISNMRHVKDGLTDKQWETLAGIAKKARVDVEKYRLHTTR